MRVDLVVWEPRGYAAYRFTRPREGDMAVEFVKYLQWKTDGTKLFGTRKEFLNYMKRPSTRGYCSSLFSLIVRAKIVTVVGRGSKGEYLYKPGPNAETFLRGEMCCRIWDWDDKRFKIALGSRIKSRGIPLPEGK
jgi:hypothetical protein